MSNHLLNLCASYAEICSGVEYFRLFVEHSSDACCHCETDIGVDIDLANGELSGMTEFFFRNTYCVRELSAEGVDFLNIFLRNGGCAVKNDRESGESLAYFFENVETERRGNEDTVSVSCALSGCELVCAVGCADGNSEGVNAGSANEVFNLFGLCVGRMFCAYLVFNACKNAELAFCNLLRRERERIQQPSL